MPVLVMATTALLALAALVAAFIDGGGLASRLLLILLHPLCVAGLLSLSPAPPQLSRTTAFAIAGLRTLTLAADLALAGLIAAGTAKGNWWIPAAFATIPAVGIVCAEARRDAAGNAFTLMPACGPRHLLGVGWIW